MTNSKPLPRRAAAESFARGNDPRTASALTFIGNVAFSYREPIAVRDPDSNRLYATNVGRVPETSSLTATFSATTAQHVGAVVGAWAVENGVGTVEFVSHRWIRSAARDALGNAIIGNVGAKFDA